VTTGLPGFNLAEGVVDHHILTIHHVRDDVSDPLPWDLGFLGFGALLVLIGLMFVRVGQANRPATGARSARA
jgi:uncharacterized membrane protein